MACALAMLACSAAAYMAPTMPARPARPAVRGATATVRMQGQPVDLADTASNAVDAVLQMLGDVRAREYSTRAPCTLSRA